MSPSLLNRRMCAELVEAPFDKLRAHNKAPTPPVGPSISLAVGLGRCELVDALKRDPEHCADVT